jgi:hypothetical protein
MGKHMVNEPDLPGQGAEAPIEPPGSVGRLREIYRRTVIRRGRAGGFLISASFLLATLAVRAITHAIHNQRFSFLLHNISPHRGFHVHHSVLGILGLLGVGYTDIRFRPERAWIRRVLAVSYGIAAALTLDEFALWLRLADVYWSPEGRESIGALIFAGGGSLLAVEGLNFWQALLRDVAWLLFRRGTPYPPIEARTPRRVRHRG